MFLHAEATQHSSFIGDEPRKLAMFFFQDSELFPHSGWWVEMNFPVCLTKKKIHPTWLAHFGRGHRDSNSLPKFPHQIGQRAASRHVSGQRNECNSQGFLLANGAYPASHTQCLVWKPTPITGALLHPCIRRLYKSKEEIWGNFSKNSRVLRKLGKTQAWQAKYLKKLN